MAGLSSVGVRVPVGELTFEPSQYSLPSITPDISVTSDLSAAPDISDLEAAGHSVDYAGEKISSAPVSSDAYSGSAAGVATFPTPQATVDSISAPSISAPAASPEFSLANEDVARAHTRMTTRLDPVALGHSTVQFIDSQQLAVFEFGRFPISDAGACEMALTVLHELKMSAAEPKAVLVHIRSVSAEYIPQYSGRQEETHNLYPCLLLDQALPIGTPFKVVCADKDFMSVLKDAGYHRFVADSVEEALAAERREWRPAGSFHEELSFLPSRREALEMGERAIETRLAQTLHKAARYVPPVPESQSAVEQDFPRAA